MTNLISKNLIIGGALIGASFVSTILIGINTDNKVITESRIGDIMVTPTPKVTNPLVSPKLLVIKTPDTNVTMMSPISSPSKTLTPTLELSTSPSHLLSTTKISGRVIINEIAWSGTSASATDEWVELYNTESDPVDISSWQLVSGDESPDIIFSEGTVMQGNSYFLIERTDDSTVSDIMADLVIGFGQGGLNNTGEMIRFFDSAGTIVDLIGGSGETWYFGDVGSKNSMERIDSMKAGNYASNWKSFSGTAINKDATGNLIYGTPKTKNSTPTLVATGSGAGGSFSHSSSGSTVTPSPSTTPSLTPTPTASPTPTPSASESPIPSPTLTPAIYTVVINEIAWMGTATSSNDEWIELYNPTNAPVDLSGWTLKSKDGTPNITLSGIISSLGFYLLERTNDLVISDLTADKIYSGALGNGGEGLELRDGSGNIVDSADFSSSWPAGDNATKSSMERIDSNKSGDDSTNWASNNGQQINSIDAGGIPINGTPKSQNSAI